MVKFVGDYGVKALPHIVDESGDIWTAFGVSYQPAWAIIRKDGTWESALGSIPAPVVREAVSG